MREDERRHWLVATLTAAEESAGYELLIGILELPESDGLRANALAVVLSIADELGARQRFDKFAKRLSKKMGLKPLVETRNILSLLGEN